MNYIFEPVNVRQLRQFIRKQEVKKLIVGVEKLTGGNKMKLSICELNKILEKTDKISLDIKRIFHEDELELLESTLKEISLDKVDFIFYSDLAVYEMLSIMGYKEKAVYDAYTYLTNRNDILLYSEFNKYVVISNQISIDEMSDLVNNINIPVMIHGFGRSVIFYSKRELLTNYFKYRNLNKNSNEKDYYLKEEFREDLYPIYEDEHGTYVYEYGYYYLFEELSQFDNVEYAIIHSTLLSAREYKKITNCYLNNDIDGLMALNLKLYKGIMENKSVLLKSEVVNNE